MFSGYLYVRVLSCCLSDYSVEKMSNQMDDKDEDGLTNFVEPDENEWRKYFDE